jgi:hypothetical protein
MASRRDHCAWLFEAKGIQRYVFAAGPLREVIGASEIVSSIASSDKNDLIGAVLAAMGDPLGDDPIYSRRAGGAFCLHGPAETLERVRAQFTLALSSAFPGLEYSDGLGGGGSEIEAMRAAFKNSAGIRGNMAASILPLGRPAMTAAPSTGHPAVELFHYRRDDDPVRVDAVTLPQRIRGEALQGKLDGVALRFLRSAQDPDGQRYDFPRNRDNREAEDTADNPLFPWRENAEGEEMRDRRIAVVHADLSGLGETFRRMGAGFTEARQNLALATAIERAVTEAAREACENTLLGNACYCHDKAIIPARPILLGGDDITIIVRADLAPDFAADLLERIEEKARTPAIGGLSACAGVAIVGSGAPFLMAHALAESLCKYAKGFAKDQAIERPSGEPFPSALAFHAQQQSERESYGDIVARLKGSNLILTGNPWAVGARSAELMNRPDFARLIDLANAIGAVPGAAGALREIESELARGAGAAAATAWRRWRGWSLRNTPDGRKAIDDAVRGITGAPVDDHRVPDLRGATPLFDALRLIDFGAVGKAAAPSELQGAA